MYDHTGKLEDAMRVGVNRNMYASVWFELIDSLFVGASIRVPYVRHDIYFEVRKTLGNLLLHGFTSCVYFPIQLLNVVAMFCLFVEALDNSILQVFLHYLLAREK